MKNFFKLDFNTVIIGILLLIIGYQYFTNKIEISRLTDKTEITPQKVKIDGKKYNLLNTKIDTVYITKTQIKRVKGDDIYHETFIEGKEVTNIDTIFVIQDYIAKTVYNDSLLLDNNLGVVTLIDTISQNRIIDRQWHLKLNQTTINKTTTVQLPPKNQLYVGLNGGMTSVGLVNHISTGLILKTKKDRILQLNFGITNNQITPRITPYVGAGIYWKIKLKK